MYTDIINYKLAEGVTEEQLLEAADEILNSWMKDQDGFLGWQINRNGKEYTDIVTWKDKESAKKAEAAMGDIPKDNAWYACYDFSTVTSKNLTELYKYGK